MLYKQLDPLLRPPAPCIRFSRIYLLLGQVTEWELDHQTQNVEKESARDDTSVEGMVSE